MRRLRQRNCAQGNTELCVIFSASKLWTTIRIQVPTVEPQADPEQPKVTVA
jgi:hypothetical protein